MAVEARRGCGYRKVGGLYLMGGTGGMPCCKMPIPLHVCPTCHGGIKQTRGWSWIDPQPWIKGTCQDRLVGAGLKLQGCPLAVPGMLGDKVGLLWIGEKFYPTSTSFSREADELGISRRISAIPRGFKVGEHWVFLAHPKAVSGINPETGEEEWTPGVFKVFCPTRIEKIITETMSQNEELMKDLADRGITPVVVPDHDRDHQGSVYDDDQTELPLHPVK